MKAFKPIGDKVISAKGIAFPVDTILITATDNNPSNWTYGTWEAFGQGRCLVGVDTSQTEFNTVLKTGGSKYMQRHSHGFNGVNDGAGLSSSFGSYPIRMYQDKAINWSNGSGISSAGDGDSQNLQPYITVYFWRRVS